VDYITLLLGIIGIAGTIGTFYFGIQYNRLAIQRYRYSWSDVESGCRQISKKCIKKFQPDAILTFSGPGSIIANLALIHSRKYIPIYTAVEFPQGDKNKSSLMSDCIMLETAKWVFRIPNAFTIHKGQRVAIIHDCSVSGVGLDKIIRGLVDIGFSRENLYVSSLVCTKAALDANLAPDFYPFLVENNEFSFPWGKRN